MRTLEIVRCIPWDTAPVGSRFARVTMDGTAESAQEPVESARDWEAAMSIDGVVWVVTPAGQTLVIRARSIETCKVVDDDGETVLRIVQRDRLYSESPQNETLSRLQSVPNETTEGTSLTPVATSKAGS